jgi:hypothetical protein
LLNRKESPTVRARLAPMLPFDQAKVERDRDAVTILEETIMITLLLIVLIVLALGSAPAWPYSRQWGYGPSAGLGTVLIIILVLWVLGVIGA